MELAVERRVCAARLDSFVDKLDHFAVYFMKPVAGFVSYGVDRVERDEHFQIAVYLIDIAGIICVKADDRCTLIGVDLKQVLTFECAERLPDRHAADAVTL